MAGSFDEEYPGKDLWYKHTNISLRLLFPGGYRTVHVISRRSSYFIFSHTFMNQTQETQSLVSCFGLISLHIYAQHTAYPHMEKDIGIFNPVSSGLLQ